MDEFIYQAFCPASVKFKQGIDAAIGTYHLNSLLRQAHFLAQIAHESGGFTHLVENLNYSAVRLQQIFPKYFPSVNIAAAYEHKPEMIANRVYANRMGNGSEESGDGWKYKGRGLIQLTGKENYKRLGYADNPERLLNPYYAGLCAGGYWDSRGCNSPADHDDLEGVTRLVNGGLNGLDDRKKWLNKAKDVLGYEP